MRKLQSSITLTDPQGNPIDIPIVPPSDVIPIALRSLQWLKEHDEREAVRETIAEFIEAYELPDSWKLELWAALPLDLQKWMKG